MSLLIYLAHHSWIETLARCSTAHVLSLRLPGKVDEQYECEASRSQSVLDRIGLLHALWAFWELVTLTNSLGYQSAFAVSHSSYTSDGQCIY